MIGRFKCQMCKHFLTPDRNIQDWKCEAFPDGISEEKLCYITRDPCINCNNGIGFEPIQKEDEPAPK